MKNSKKFSAQLRKARRLTDAFILITCHAANDFRSKGKDLEAGFLTDLILTLQKVESQMGYLEIQIGC
jgi:hypothetical protein